MKIALAADHAGFTLKEAVATHLRQASHEIKDFGTYSLDSVDYPDYLYPATLAVAKGECDRGILVAGAAYAGGIIANKVPGIRAAACEDLWATKISRQHGDANILCLSGYTLGAGIAREMVDVFLGTAFLGGKYAARNDKVSKIESGWTGQSADSLRSNPAPDPRKDALDLITEKDVESALHFGKSLVALRSALVTPSAKDLIEAKGIEIQWID